MRLKLDRNRKGLNPTTPTVRLVIVVIFAAIITALLFGATSDLGGMTDCESIYMNMIDSIIRDLTDSGPC